MSVAGILVRHKDVTKMKRVLLRPRWWGRYIAEGNTDWKRLLISEWLDSIVTNGD